MLTVIGCHFSSVVNGGPGPIASWATTGSAFATGSNTALAALDGTDIAVLDTVDDELQTLRWGGSSFSQVGNALSIAMVPQTQLVRLTNTRIARIDPGAGNKLIQAYDWDGTNWTAKGNAFVSTVNNYSNAARLKDNEIAFWDANNLKKIVFDGTDFSIIGNILSMTGNFHAIAPLTANTVAVASSANDDVKTFSFDGTNWSQVGNTFAISPVIAGFYGIEGISSTQIVIYDSNTTVQTLVWDGTNWADEGSSSSLTGLDSWTRGIAKMSDTLIAYNSFGDADVRAAVATLA